MSNLVKLISINPTIRFVKPCIAGIRIAVVDILTWLASGMSFEEIIEDFPALNLEKIQAALAFAVNRERFVKLIAV